jgi:hypothetical protein
MVRGEASRDVAARGVADDDGAVGARVVQHGDQVRHVGRHPIGRREMRAAAPATQVRCEHADAVRDAAQLTCDAAIVPVAARHAMDQEHDGPTRLGRRSPARNGQRAAGHGNVEVRLEGVSHRESPA